MNDIGITDRNLLLEQIYEKFYVKFVQHWGCKYNPIKIFQKSDNFFKKTSNINDKQKVKKSYFFQKNSKI